MDNSRDLTETVWNFILQHKMIESGDTVVVGVSGGADSVCLLFMLKEMRERLPFTLLVVHVEHGIRGEASRQDACFVKKLCETLSIPFRLFKEDVPTAAKNEKLSLEEAGRLARYRAFKKAADSYPSAKIAIAHHMDDQAETVLFHMIRGSGLRGLGGIAPVRDNIIRPLLCISRDEIEQYLEERRIVYCTDMTNQELIYSRNLLRNKAIPILEEIQEASVAHIVRAAKEVREAEDYIAHQAEILSKKAVRNEGQGFAVSVGALCKEEPVIRRQLIKNVLCDLFGEWKDLTRTHVDEILSLSEKSPGKEISLPKNRTAMRLKEEIYLGFKPEKQESEPTFQEILVDVEGRTEIGNGCSVVCSIFDAEKIKDIPQNIYTKWFDYDKIKNSLFIRTRKERDFLYLDEALGKQKLKNYFINKKIPREERSRVLLLAMGNEIVWIIGYRISGRFKVTEQTKRILEIQAIGGIYDG